jgi:DNA mismatch repair protein MutL
MPIQILPARLANQIAAGEVVERPASVVKELIENSLDAGATQIEIDIEKGGAKSIRIKDNGSGVSKEQLTLALSRHATSKISHLDDLEAIVSLGFRGEALASISSVSRLTFTSKPQDQEQAWQALAEGRDMQVNIQPAAHPQGTTVEVLDLFFNTPARRRFLKTEKTEFQHIDELIRRIALSCFSISIVLKHNGKVIRQYRAAQTTAQINKRLASICSEGFVKSALAFESEDAISKNEKLKISGWISDKHSARLLADVQYCYINGRMIRDKLVNHAIKQAYARLLPAGYFPGYVIYINCPAEQVDVNVHPSKHEVRFHQARWVHDYIVSTLASTINSEDNKATYSEHDYQPNHENQASETQFSQAQSNDVSSVRESHVNSQSQPQTRNQVSYQSNYRSNPIDEKQVSAYCDFVTEAHHPLSNPPQNKAMIDSLNLPQTDFEVISLIDNKYVLIKLVKKKELILLSLINTSDHIELNRLMEAWENGEVISQPLLLPVRIEVDDAQFIISERFETLFTRFGFSFKTQAKKLIISKVPALLRQAPIARILPLLFEFLGEFEQPLNEHQVKLFCAFMVKQASKEKLFDMSEITPLLSSFTQTTLLKQDSLYIKPDLSLLLQGFPDE